MTQAENAVLFPKCQRDACHDSALSFSNYCWAHVEQEAYIAHLRRSLSRAKRDVSTVLNLKKVECEGLDLTDLNLQGSSLDQTKLSRCVFIGSDLSRANLIGANLIRCDFVGANLSDANFTRAVFSHSTFSFADLSETCFIESVFRDTDLMGAVMWKTNLWNADLSGAAHIKMKNFYDPTKPTDSRFARLSEESPLVALESYRNVKHYFYGHGLVEDASWAAYRELTMERKFFYHTRDFRYIPSLLMDLLSGYTENPNRVIASSLGIVLLYGLAYYLLGAVRPMTDIQAAAGFWDSIYFSFITFTTVGFGDFVPQPLIGMRMLVCMEAFSGPFMAGLYIFTLTRRYAAH